MQKIRLFVSSPSDVAAERRRVDNVVKRIRADYEGVDFEVIRWEEAFYTASSTFQDQIDSPADADIVLCILWKRLGSPLPDEYKRADGSSRTGTEYEFETAMEAALTAELPDILVYRKTAEITFTADHVDQERAELQTLESFWRRWIQNEKGHFTAGFKPFEATDEFEQQLEKDLRAWMKRRFHHVTWPEGKGSPYRGLEVFDEEHAPIYFGRRRAINEVRARLIANEQRDGVGFLLIIGASGAGKSSLVRAGLIPALKHSNPIEGVAGWRTLVIRPTELGSDPVHGLVGQLCEAGVLPELLQGDYAQPRELSELWKSSPNLAAKPIESALKRWGKLIAEQEQFSHEADTRLLITIDQFEELFQLEPEQQLAFLNVIDSLSRSGRVWIIATMRSDFYPQLFSLPELLSLKDASRQYDLAVPRPHELQEIITGPAAAAGLQFEQHDNEGLEQRLLEDAEGNPTALPLLEFTLERLYQERDRDNKQLSFAAYEQLGGLQGALTQTAEEAFASIEKRFTDKAATVFARVMRELVAIDEQGKATRRVAPHARFELNSNDKLLIDTLLDKRLLTGYTAEISGSDEPEAVVNITHESLIHHWDRMQHWLEQDQELLQVRERIAQDCQRWLNEYKRRDMLATSGKRLEDIRYLKDSGLQLDDNTAEFIHDSLARAKQLQKRKRILQAGFSAISIAAAIFGVITLNSLDELSSQRREISQKEKELINNNIETTGLIAQSEYARASLLKKQANNSQALAGYYKTISRARESGALQQGEEKQQKGKHKKWLVDILRKPTWQLGWLKDSDRSLAANSFSPLLSNNKRLLLSANKIDDGDFTFSLTRIADSKQLFTAVTTKANLDFFNIFNASFSPDDKTLALVTETGEKRNKQTVIRIADTGTGKFTDSILSNVEDKAYVRHLDVNSLLVTDNSSGEVKIWDTRSSNDFNSLQTIIDSQESLYRIFIVSPELVLVNNYQLWQKQAGDAWEHVATTGDAPGYLGISGLPDPLLNKNGFTSITREFDSWLPEWLLTGLISFMESSPGMEAVITSLVDIEIKTQLAITSISGRDVSTEFHDVPLPDKAEKWKSGFVSFPKYFAYHPESDSSYMVIDYLVLDFGEKGHGEESYGYEIKTVNMPVFSEPRYILNISYADEYRYVSGVVRLQDKWLLSSSQGYIYQFSDTDSSVAMTRVAKKVTSMRRIDDKLFISGGGNTFILKEPVFMAGKSAEKSLWDDAAHRAFFKYQAAYGSGINLVSNNFNENEDNLAIYHENEVSEDNSSSSRRRAKKNEVYHHTPMRLRDLESMRRQGLLGSYISSVDDKNAVSFLAASPVGLQHVGNRVESNVVKLIDKSVNNSPVSLASVTPYNEHFAILSEDNKLHFSNFDKADELRSYSGIKPAIRKISAGNEYIAAATIDGKLHIVDNKTNKHRSLDPARIDSSQPTITDRGARLAINKKATLKGTISSLQWHPSQAVLAASTWQGGLYILPVNKSNNPRRIATALHTNTAPLNQLTWHPDGSHIATADRQGIVNLWATKIDNKSVSIDHANKLQHDSTVISISYSLDGKWLVTATDTDNLYFWKADGTAIGQPLALDNIEIQAVHIHEDNWGVIIIDKQGQPHIVEAGDRFIPENVINMFDLIARKELFNNMVTDNLEQDNQALLQYFRTPPASDKSYWTTLISKLLLCGDNSECSQADKPTEYVYKSFQQYTVRDEVK